MQPKTKRAVRTSLQTFVAVVTLTPAAAAIAADSDALAAVAPWAVAAASTAAAVAGTLARIMAHPAVEALLDRVGLGLVDNEGRQ